MPVPVQSPLGLIQICFIFSATFMACTRNKACTSFFFTSDAASVKERGPRKNGKDRNLHYSPIIISEHFFKKFAFDNQILLYKAFKYILPDFVCLLSLTESGSC